MRCSSLLCAALVLLLLAVVCAPLTSHAALLPSMHASKHAHVSVHPNNPRAAPRVVAVDATSEDVAAAAAAAAATVDSVEACTNSCSGNGLCVGTQCVCDAGYLGLDCSIASAMPAPAAASNGGGTVFTLIYAYVKNLIYLRATVTPSAGWGGLLFGTATGMDNGTGLLISYQNGMAQVQDISSLGYTVPTILTNVSSVSPSSIAAFVNTTSDTLDIQFQRLADTGIPGLYVLPTSTGVNTSVSLAVGSVYFQHHLAALCSIIDVVAFSQGDAVGTPCPSPP